MARNALICWVIGLVVCPVNVNAGMLDFEDAPEESKPAESARPEEVAELRYVVPGTAETMVEATRKCIAHITERMTKAIEAGDTRRHDVLSRKRDEFSAVLERMLASPAPPSIYPLQLNKKGCIYAVKRVTVSIEDAAPSEEMQMISWFSVKVVDIQPGGAVKAEIYDNSGRVLLYRVQLIGMDTARMKPGSSVKLVNFAFECVAEEVDADRPTYHLKLISLAALSNAKKDQ